MDKIAYLTKEILSGVNEIFMQPGNKITYTLRERAQTPDGFYLKLKMGDGMLVNPATTALDGAAVQGVLSELSNAYTALTKEGFTVNELGKSMNNAGYHTAVFGNGKILEIGVGDISVAYISPKVSLNELSAFLEGRNTVNGFGINNAVSMAAQTFGGDTSRIPLEQKDGELTIGRMEDAINNGKTFKYVFDYPGAVIESARLTDKLKGAGTFKSVHGVSVDDRTYRNMTLEEMLNIGTSDASKKAGVAPLDWKLMRTGPNGFEEELFESSKVTSFDGLGKGYAVGIGGFTAYFGSGFIVNVGDRGPAGNFINNVLQGKTKELENVRGIDILLEDIVDALDGRKNSTCAIQIGGKVETKRGKVSEFFRSFEPVYYNKRIVF